MQKLALVLVSFCLIINPSVGLKCYYKSKELMPEKSNTFQNDTETKYECEAGDKYCVSLEGILVSLTMNFTFAMKSCESDIKKYLTPVSERIGSSLEYSCNEEVKSAVKTKNVGPLTYWYACCATDICNGTIGTLPNAHQITSVILLAILLFWKFL